MPLNELEYAAKGLEYDAVTYASFTSKESILSQELYALWLDPSIITKASCTLFPDIEIPISL